MEFRVWGLSAKCGYKTPEQTREKSEDFVIVARVAMSPSHAKAMIPILERMVRTYERDSGKTGPSILFSF